MKIRVLFRMAGCGLLAGCAALALTGCGGGSSAATGGGTTVRSALSGTVTAPQSQTRSVKSRDAGDPLVPVGGASVTLVNLDDAATPGGATVGTTTTGADGSYAFPTVTPGTNYKVEATKTIGGKTLKLEAIVTAPPAAAGSGSGTGATPAPVTHDLTPNTTVAAVTTILQLAALKQADPNAQSANLQAFADDLEKKRQDANTPPPDLTNPDAVTESAHALQQASAPDGSYTGTAITTAVGVNSREILGDTTELAAQIDSTGHFYLVALPHDDKTGRTDTGADGGGDGTGQDSGNGTGSGNNDGGGHSNNDGNNYAKGTVTTDGIVNAVTVRGNIKIVGLFTAGVGIGTWQMTDGSARGTWKLILLKTTFAGLYAGKYVTDSSPQTGGDGNNGANGTGGRGDFAVLVKDDNTVVIMGAGPSDSDDSITGTGTVDSSGVLTFQIFDAHGTGTVNATTHEISGTFTTDAGEAGHFTGRSNHADNSDL